MHKSNGDKHIIAMAEMHDLIKLAMKYSPKQIARMAFAIEIEDLQNDMIKHGATKDEIRAASELEHDVNELYWELIDSF